jgi:UDP:flavonoid glycosyltransferase YjiC (YdhE family)
VKFALASWGSRGEVEPCTAVGRELLRRGHQVRLAVPPDLVDFAKSAGLAAVGYGPDLQTFLGAYRKFWTYSFRNFWRVPEVISLWSEVSGPIIQHQQEMTTTLTSLAKGADLIFTSLSFEDAAANVAEYYDIPLATMHWFPMRANGQLLSFLPAPLSRSAMTVYEWLSWWGTKKVEDQQRRELGLPKATRPAARRIIERGWLEIQAYDEVCFPGLAAEWAEFGGQRPFVGALTLELATGTDQAVASWIADGTPPIFFGFGSMPVQSPAETITMISTVCDQLAERALVCAGGTDFGEAPRFEHVKVVPTVNYAGVFPACRAVVHHGGAGTTAAGLRAGVPTLILSTDLDQTLWAARIKKLKAGAARRLSRTTQKSLIADLRTILAPQYVTRAREIASMMTKPAESVTAAADLVEKLARTRRVR